MATYNGAEYLKEQIDSILSQTIQDFELVICDDCSVDGTYPILQEYAEKDRRIRVCKNDTNLGFKKNFEKAISLCKGEFIALSDQDDIWLPNHIELLLDNMTGTTQVICGDALIIDQCGAQTGEFLSDIESMYHMPESNSDKARHIILGHNSFQGASMLMKKDILKFALPIPETNYHDVWFASLACFYGGLAYIDQPVLKYRRHGNEITADKFKKNSIRTFLGATFVNHALIDRLSVVESIKDRLVTLSVEQKDLLNTFEKMLRRRNYIWGRLQNVPYILKHFCAIYTTDYKHLFI